MLSLDETVDALRKRVLLAKGLRPLIDLAREMQISPLTLTRWIRNEQRTTFETLESIERWCVAQESPPVVTTESAGIHAH